MTIVHAFHIKSIFIFPRAAQVEKSLTNKFSTFEPQEKHEEKWSEIMSDSSNENSIGKIHMISTIYNNTVNYTLFQHMIYSLWAHIDQEKFDMSI